MDENHRAKDLMYFLVVVEVITICQRFDADLTFSTEDFDLYLLTHWAILYSYLSFNFGGTFSVRYLDIG